MPTTYTSCASCGGLLTVEREGQMIHEGCPLDNVDTTNRAIIQLLEVFDEDTAKRVEILEEAPPKLGASALWYAEHYGWPVFPLVPGSKVPATSRGFHDATVHSVQIRDWWKTNPDYNIGLPTGHRFDVIDVDVPDGTFSWAYLRDSETCPDIHGWVSTPSGGWHVYITPTGGGNLTKFLPGVDFRGVGGYVVAAPSVLSEHDGRRYRWYHYASTHIKG